MKPESSTEGLGIVICPHCDGLFQGVPLRPREIARCPDCRAVLKRSDSQSLQTIFAYVITGVIALGIAVMNPLMVATLQGSHEHASLLDASSELVDPRYAVAAFALIVTTLVIPLVQVGSLTWLLIFALLGRRAPGFRPLLVLLHELRPWAMVEVFFLGSLIVIVKIASWVSVTVGPGLLALAAFSLLVGAVARFDSSVLWSIPLK